MSYERQIGPIPDWIKELRGGPGYTNPFQIAPNAPTIFGNEHFMGDWQGEALVLLQDFAPANEVRSLKRRGFSDEDVYRHNDGDSRYQTGKRSNQNLATAIFGDRSFIDGRCASNCGIVCGNVCFFLKDAMDKSAPLTGFQAGSPAFDGSMRVLKHVIESMPQLRIILLCGGAAQKAQTKLGEFAPQIEIVPAPHPRTGGSPHTSLGRVCDDRLSKFGVGQWQEKRCPLA